jgi:hypothetical protein
LAHPFIVIDVADFSIKIANSAAKGDAFKDGMTCHELNHGHCAPCSSDEHRCVVREVVATRRPVTLEHFHAYDKEEESEHEVHAFPLLNSDGKVVQVIQYCIDITEKKRLEAIADAANLMTNAADAFDHHDNALVSVDVKPISADLVQVLVSDNGCGMSTSERQNLFRPFYTSKPQGTGLGLVIIKKMLARMNSTIRIESSSGWGTTVTMCLPAGEGGHEQD